MPKPKYFLQKSIVPYKKLDVIKPDGNKISFGAKGYSDFILSNGDELRKQRYIKRHQKNEDWNNPNTAGFWSRWLLWNKPNILESIKDTERRFKIKILII